MFSGILGISWVHESPGKVMSYAIPNAVRILPEDLNDTHINMLDDAKFVTFCTYPNYDGIYVTNGRTMAADGSDYKYVETRRVVNKYYRLIQQAATLYVQSEASEDDLPGFKAHLEAAGDQMADADPREIVSHKIIIPEGQDIISTEKLKVKCSLVPVPIMRNIDIDIELDNPFRR